MALRAADVYTGNLEECKESDNLCKTLVIDGEIEKGDNNRLESEIERTRHLKGPRDMKVFVTKIHLDSGGGDLLEAMDIGRTIRREKLDTLVTFDSRCYSACVMAHLGGVFRAAAGEVGIHSFYSKDAIGPTDFERASKEFNRVAVLVAAYLREMRVPSALLEEMMRIPHFQLRKIHPGEHEAFGILGVDPLWAQIRHQKPFQPLR